MSECMVRVEWVDACCYQDDVPQAWIDSRSKAGGIPTESIGILMRVNRKCVILALSHYGTDHNEWHESYQEVLCIPRGMIKKLTYLEPRDG